MISGDFIIHVQKHDDRNVHKFLDILEQYGLKQHVETPTRASGNTIDLIMTRKTDAIVRHTSTSTLVSDHLLVSTTIDIAKNLQPPSNQSFGN